MGNSLSERKRQKERGDGIQKKMEEEEKISQEIVTILIMGQGTVHFLNALQCIRDGGLNIDIKSQCKAYIYHQMIFEMKTIIKKTMDENNLNNNINRKEWSYHLYRHCVTDKLLIYGFIKSFMVYDEIKRKYSISDRQVVWNKDIPMAQLKQMNAGKGTTDYLISGGLTAAKQIEPSLPETNALLNGNTSDDHIEPESPDDAKHDDDDDVDEHGDEDETDEYTNYDDRVYISADIMRTILAYYQSHDTVQQWLNILLFSRTTQRVHTLQSSSAINHYILNHVNIGQFILDMFNEFDSEQQQKLFSSYDIGIAHYFSDLDRICAAEYLPTSTDIIFMSNSIGFSLNRSKLQDRRMTNNQNEVKDIEFNASIYHFTNIQPMFRTQVKRWIYQFEDKCDSLIFLIPLTTYYKWDSKWDTFNLIKNFQTITNNNYLTNSSFHLFLTQKEIFKDKIKQTPFRFAQYDGDNSYDSCIEYLIDYLKSKLIADNKGMKRQMFIHVVSLFNLEQLKSSFAEVCSVIKESNSSPSSSSSAINQPIVPRHQQMNSQQFQL